MGQIAFLYSPSLVSHRSRPVNLVFVVTQHKLSHITTIVLRRAMSRMGSACNCNGVASEDATSPASRASEVHMPSATKPAFNKPAQPPARYDKTAVVLLGWEPDYCDTGVAPEVSFNGQSRSTDAY